MLSPVSRVQLMDQGKTLKFTVKVTPYAMSAGLKRRKASRSQYSIRRGFDPECEDRLV